MKRLILFIVMVSIIVLSTDILLGFCCRYYINHHRLMGEFGEIDYIVNSSNDSIIILGSSVALNGLNSNIIEDSIGISCYNSGANGQIIPYYESLFLCSFINIFGHSLRNFPHCSSKSPDVTSPLTP